MIIVNICQWIKDNWCRFNFKCNILKAIFPHSDDKVTMLAIISLKQVIFQSELFPKLFS